MKKLQFLRCGNGSNFEISEYSSPDQNPVQPRNSDVGGHHLAFYVDDIDSAVQYLRMHDVRILGEPLCGEMVRVQGKPRARILPEWQGL